MSEPEPSVPSIPNARDAVRALRPSQIREVANAGFGVADVLPFWFGESDRVTPAFIRDAASAALQAGETFYTHNLGIAPLRSALADYVSELHGATSPDHIAVTSAGVNALMLAAQLVVGAGDRAVAVTPLWPNLVEIPKILGAHVETVSLDYGEHGWQLDVGRLLSALTPDTKMLLVNSPNNPTGWVMTREQQRAVLAHCRRHGIWIVADEVYERLYYPDPDPDPAAEADGAAPGRTAPSFLDLAARDERVICVNSFSKAWLMTGWRLGWIVAPQRLMDDLGKLVEYNTSCAPAFVQHAGIAAVRDGERFTLELVRDLKASRDHLVQALSTVPGVDVKAPKGAMYLFFTMEGASRSLELCKAMVREVGLGIAPGSAFGPEGEGFLRWCYACDIARLDAGVERLKRFLAQHGRA
ncbi:pyridoxal phosphate-dependent aminotransferase [bacterium M00.F.Ca.ET.228.01.1.1]|uniref:pyridoxal phosphate-dependent aminotransferase n=1 Tax=Paraburkholderia phenoliruptrix TaxID=252970 RepID=UPI001092C745|nr:pyridoxal phosphate-dependent aminotransferase [Paraburkholderia phenoliruptrix]TGP42394.1 pyridoxal phosphate-dependent aminotransferase [bacterium M00.F.Ca.ET.228.01.1.1]TGS00044.1 pyridoxal phosphate-dependent aminotransferase [bacterium M00.F.Ca.ET.191.01.1.1]TGU04364.1 pyridoxal phosphate-dependent aminotransferase [bacterium M00.F.Ca.ET.155.01.1.1]MBW0450126.1 pyridoxal phosphate-dependent aminotransferase [Paraburkholderia phenoliruptrix]MBW9098618.1 pyridoxal phosphate-dependent ami